MGTGLVLRPSSSLAEPFLAETVGRTFALTPIRRQPALAAPIMSHLPPHTTTPITALTADGHWYQLPDGYVQRAALQPIAPYQQPTIESDLGFYAGMIAPVSSLRAWCAARAPIIATLGYGAILYVADRLTDDRGAVWYGLAAHPQGETLGWSPALHFARWQPVSVAQRPTRLHLDMKSSHLVAYHADRPIVRLPIAMHGTPPPRCTVQAVSLTASGDLPLGAPYQFRMGAEGRIVGSYWHNHFVREPQEFASNIQIEDKVTAELPIYAARWLYSALGSDETVMTIE
ncbi:MAG: hypothetical protein KF716_00150 [Anaerolineae bacterium]|nr:hypothetical protein [Anaerolineae bacterium]